MNQTIEISQTTAQAGTRVRATEGGWNNLNFGPIENASFHFHLPSLSGKSSAGSGRFVLEVDPLPEPAAASRIIDDLGEDNVTQFAIDILRAALIACKSDELAGLRVLLANWIATAEELSLGDASVTEILAARDALENGQGITLNELFPDD